MTIFSAILLLSSIILSTGRNTFSKSISTVPIKSKAFFLLQATIFFSGSIVLAVANGFSGISATTMLLSLAYAAFLILAQWNYTYALKNGNIGICAIVYSLGFIIPTILGFIFWGENPTPLKLLGIALVIPAIIISGNKSDNTAKNNKYFFPLILAMTASGGLGVLQKIHQSTVFKDELTGFVLIAFLIAGTVSILVQTLIKSPKSEIPKNHFLFAILVGLCFSIANLLNTKLTGLLDSSVFFPILNVGSILASVLAGFVIFKEKLNLKTCIILVLGFGSILLINLG